MPAEKPRPPSPVHDLPTPQNVRAERACLALILGVRVAPKAAQVRASLLDRLSEDWFSTASRRAIFAASKRLVAQGVTPGLAEVYDQFTEPERIARIDQELIDCYQHDEIPALADADYWAGKVADAAARRMVSDQAMLVRTEIASGADTAEVLAATAESIEAAKRVASGAIVSDAFSSAQVTTELLDQIEASQRGELRGIPTGLGDLDAKLGGFRNSDLVVLAARPSMGKSALSCWFAMQVAKAGTPAAIFSLEMQRTEIQARLLSSMSGVPLASLRDGTLRDDQWGPVTEAASELHGLPLTYVDSGPLDLVAIKTRMRHLQRERGIAFAVIDYLQIVPSGSRAENRTQEVSYLSRELKGLARDLGIPIVLVSQLSRATESRQGNRPKLSDLRESGAIEQDADVVMLLYREDYYREDCPEEKRGVLEIDVAKQRNGPTGIVEVAFRRSHLAFRDLARDRIEPARTGYRADTEG